MSGIVNTGTRGVLAFAFAFFTTTGVWQDFRSERGGGDDERSLNQMRSSDSPTMAGSSHSKPAPLSGRGTLEL